MVTDLITDTQKLGDVCPDFTTEIVEIHSPAIRRVLRTRESNGWERRMAELLIINVELLE